MISDVTSNETSAAARGAPNPMDGFNKVLSDKLRDANEEIVRLRYENDQLRRQVAQLDQDWRSL